jgi:hypothetical protein
MENTIAVACGERLKRSGQPNIINRDGLQMSELRSAPFSGVKPKLSKETTAAADRFLYAAANCLIVAAGERSTFF